MKQSSTSSQSFIQPLIPSKSLKNPSIRKRKAHFTQNYSKFGFSATSFQEKDHVKDESFSFVIDDKLVESYIDETTISTAISFKKNDEKETKRRFSLKKEENDVKMSKKLKEILCEIHQKLDRKIEKNNKNDEKKVDKFEEKASRILQQPSLKSKYEELTQETVDYTLPSEYKALFRLFEAIDETLNFLKMRSLPQFFEEIKENLRLLGLYKFLQFFLKNSQYFFNFLYISLVISP